MWNSGNAIIVTKWAILRLSADSSGSSSSSSSEVTVGDRGNASTAEKWAIELSNVRPRSAVRRWQWRRRVYRYDLR